VAPHRVEANHQIIGDLLVALARGQEPQDLGLAQET
jgi:hypothetical protein